MAFGRRDFRNPRVYQHLATLALCRSASGTRLVAVGAIKDRPDQHVRCCEDREQARTLRQPAPDDRDDRVLRQAAAVALAVLLGLRQLAELVVPLHLSASVRLPTAGDERSHSGRTRLHLQPAELRPPELVQLPGSGRLPGISGPSRWRSERAERSRRIRAASGRGSSPGRCVIDGCLCCHNLAHVSGEKRAWATQIKWDGIKWQHGNKLFSLYLNL